MKIAVFTCDQYVTQTEVPQLFLRLFRRFWPNCPYPIEFVSNKETVDANVPTILTGQDETWKRQALRYFKRQDGPVLLFLEDFLLKAEPDEARIASCLDVLVQHDDVAFIRLVPWPGPTLPCEFDGLGELNKQADSYLFSLMTTIWRPLDMVAILERMNYATPWELEIHGTVQLRDYPKRFLCVEEKALDYENYVRRMKPVERVHEWACFLLGIPETTEF